MNRETIMAEMDKLNQSQRATLRGLPIGNLISLNVEQVGWTTHVKCESNGFSFNVKLGPRGRKLSFDYAEVR